jgi:DNA/RNA-binding domain of Phe-tRNA-synthetase-like protein
MTPVTIHHRVARDDLGLGLVVAEPVSSGVAPAALAAALDAAIARRRGQPLGEAEETTRKRCREILRNGRYKPTGRGKPASEYLLRAALEGEFPRVNGPVDANNLVSLESLAPISLWDLDLAGTERFEIRLGREGERYVFNPSGQVLELEDLLCGCGLVSDGRSQPVVTPVKDGLATKLTPATRRVAGCIYYPLGAGGRDRLAAVTADFARWLAVCGATRADWAVAGPGESVSL